MKRSIIIVAITLTSGALIWVLGQKDLKKYSVSFLRKPEAASHYAPRKTVRNLLGIGDTAAPHTVPLSTAQVSMLDNNRIVVLMDAKGDLPGALTLTIDRDAGGTMVVGGSWALIVSYTALTPLGHPDPDGGGEAVSEELIQKGTLSGVITGGSVTVDASGKIASVDSLQLSINQGSVAFENVTEGLGSAQETNLQDAPSSTGTLILNF